MSLTNTYIIEQNAFFIEGLKSLLTSTQFKIGGVYRTFTEIQNQKPAKTKEDKLLFLLGTDAAQDSMKKQVTTLKEKFPGCMVGILTARTDIDYVAAAFAAGADGYILRDISPKALISALNMIMAGEKVYPTLMINQLVSKPHNQNSGNIRASVRHSRASRLSAREKEVLQYLAAGGTNKEIARDLDITEATVKVHVKTVLRKLDLSNRTQAAVWAVNTGLVNQNNTLFASANAA